MRLCLNTILIAFGLCASVPAAVIRVDPGGGGDYLTIQEGIDAAGERDTVLVAPGTYTGPLNRGLDPGGTNVVLRSESGSANTIIDCERADRGISFRNGESPFSLVEGFTITNGYVLHDTLDIFSGFGGGALCIQTRPRFTDVVFLNNEVKSGGAWHRDGGGVYCYEGTVRFTDCRFEGNIATNGAGVTADYAVVFFDDCTFENNTAANWGGGLYSHWDSSMLTRVTFRDNHADFGGAICYRGADCPQSLTDCVFERNSCSQWGGAVNAYHSYPMFIDCDFLYNSSAYWGAAVGLSQYRGAFIGCTFFGNRATGAEGAAVSTAHASTFTDCSFAYNGAPGGGAILCTGGSQAVIANTILAFTSGGAAVACLDTADPSISFSCVYGNAAGDSLCGSYHDNVFADPAFCDTTGGALWIEDCSPCVGSGEGGTTIGAREPDCPCSDPTSVAHGAAAIALLGAAPNPCGAGSAIRYSLAAPCREVKLEVYDPAGRLVAERSLGRVPRGEHEVVWDATDATGRRVASGVYLYALTAGERRLTGRVVVVR